MAEPRVPGTSVAALTHVGQVRIGAPSHLRSREARELCALYLALRDERPPRWLDRATVMGSLGLGFGSAWSLVTQDPWVLVTSLLVAGGVAASAQLFGQRRPILKRFEEMGVAREEQGTLLFALERVTSDRSLLQLPDDQRVPEMARRLVADV